MVRIKLGVRPILKPMSGTKVIHSKFWTDEKLLTVSHSAQLLFIGLWFLADGSGEIDKSADIKTKIFPNDEEKEIMAWLRELLKIGVVRESGDRYIIPNYARYQRSRGKTDESIEAVYGHWNSLNLRKVRTLTPSLKKAIWACIRSYGVETIKETMSLYAEVLKDKQSWYSYEYDMRGFMERGMEKFDGRTKKDFSRSRGEDATSLDLR